MRQHGVSPRLLILSVGIAVLPAAACDSTKGCLASYGHGLLDLYALAAVSTPLTRLVLARLMVQLARLTPSAAAARASRLAKDALAYPNK